MQYKIIIIFVLFISIGGYWTFKMNKHFSVKYKNSYKTLLKSGGLDLIDKKIVRNHSIRIVLLLFLTAVAVFLVFFLNAVNPLK